MKYLTLIPVIALLHQYQRPVQQVIHQGQKLEYIEVTLKDIELANRLSHEVLGRTLDELPPQSRRLLQLVTDMVKKTCADKKIEQSDYHFSRKEIREATGWSDNQLKIHLHRLEELEYLLVHRGGRGQTFVYELLYRGEGMTGKPFLIGLKDTSHLKNHAYDSEKLGVKPEKLGSSWPQVGVKLGGSWGGKNSESPLPELEISESYENEPEIDIRPIPQSASYVGIDRALSLTCLAAHREE